MAVRIASMENHHQEPPPSHRACPPAPTWLPVRRALHERRAMRRASHLAVARRPGTASSSSCSSASSINSSLVAELQRESLARRRAFVAAAHKFAVTAAAAAKFSAKQQQQQQQHQRLSLLASPAITTTTPPPPPAVVAGATATAGGAAALPRPTAVRDSMVNPEVHFLNLLHKRGRTVTAKMSSHEAGYVKQPTAKQVLDYQSQPFMSDLVRKGDLEGLRAAVEAGRGMDASNKFGESLVHIACRRGHMDVLQFLLANGGSLTCCDDIGRFPLHEVCWAVQPRFDIVRLFLDGKRRPTDSPATADDTPIGTDDNTDNNNTDNTTGSERNTSSGSSNGSSNNDNKNSGSSSSSSSSDDGLGDELNILLITDKRGCTPLRYVKEESWPMWREFLDEVVDEYWPSLV